MGRLPDLNTGRQRHACGKYIQNGEVVSSNIKSIVIVIMCLWCRSILWPVDWDNSKVVVTFHQLRPWQPSHLSGCRLELCHQPGMDWEEQLLTIISMFWVSAHRVVIPSPVLGNPLYLGGQDSSGTLSAVLRYETNNKTWTQNGYMTEQRRDHAVSTLPWDTLASICCAPSTCDAANCLKSHADYPCSHYPTNVDKVTS